MNTPSMTLRLSAAVASMAITFSLLSGVFAMAEHPIANSLLAQSDTGVVVR